MRILTAVILTILAGAIGVEAQSKRPPARKPKPVPAQTKPKTEPAKVMCPESLGVGIKTGASYCFVMAARDPSQGVLVAIPPHVGEAALSFDLHNRHTYSEEQMKAGRGFAQYTAVIGVLDMKGELIERAAVQTEFRSPRDLHERIAAGPGAVKAVAPVGAERVKIVIPAGIDQVSLLGEVLNATTAAGRESAAPGRPVALVSNLTIEYRPRR